MAIEAGTDPEIAIINADSEISDSAIDALAALLLSMIDGEDES